MAAKNGTLKELWYNLVTNGVTEQETSAQLRKIVFTNSFLFVALLTLATFGLAHVYAGTYNVGAFELFCSLLALFNVVFLRRTGKLDLACSFLLGLILIVLGFLLLTGGMQNTGIYWVYVYPVAAFFLKGKDQGKWWIFALFLIAFTIGISGEFGYLSSLPYSFGEVRQMLVSLFVVSLLVFFYENAKENNETLIKEHYNELVKKNQALLDEIAEHERTDNALRESEARFHKVIEHNVDAILVIDQHNVVRFVNPAAKALFDLQEDILIGKKFGIPVIEGEPTEFEIPKRDGTTSVVEIRTVPIEWDNEFAYLESLRDITEHKRIQEALSESQFQLTDSYRREQERRQLSDTLREVARVVSSTLDQETVINIILAQLESVVTYHRVTVMFITESGDLKVVAGRDNVGNDEVGTIFSVEKYPINATILQSKQPLLVPDIIQDARWKSTDATQGIRSFIGTPLLVQERPIGILTLGRRDTIEYSDDDSQTVFAFATQVAIAIHNALLHEKTQERNRRLALLHHISLAVNSTLDLSTLLRSACRELVKNFHVDRSGVLLFDKTYTYGEVMAEFPSQNAMGIRIPLEGYTVTQQMIETGQPQVVYDAQHDPGMEKVWEIMRALGIRSILFVPLISQGQVIGSFSLDITVGQRHFTQSEIELTQTIASQLATAIDNARLLENERTRIERELETARQVQMSLFPPGVPSIPGLDIAGVSRPARMVGGDFYNYFIFEPQHIGIAVGDVSGKGMQAALMMALSVGLLSTEARRENSPAVLLANLNYELRPHTQRNKKNTAMTYLCLSSSNRSDNQNNDITVKHVWDVRVANAGLVAPLLRRRDGTVDLLDANGLPLGMIPDVVYTECQETLAPGDLILLSSDGLVETRNNSGELYGFDRLVECMVSAPCHTAQAAQEHVLTDVQKFSGDAEAHDDLTIVVIMVLKDDDGCSEKTNA